MGFPSNTLHSTQKLKKRQLKKGFRKREEGKVVYYEKKRQV
jgi:hypothetical protein